MRKRTIAEWESLAAEYKQSGKTQKEWCREKGINLNTFCDRLSRLRNADTKTIYVSEEEAETEEKTKIIEARNPDTISWVEVRRSETGNAKDINCESEKSPGAESGITVKIGAFGIIIDEGFNESVLLKVCAALKRLC